jgi:pyruvate/2-oxoglutarate dehydrogenase complex dihydrolipoamide dehydrogenase (E3) component
MQMNPIWFEFKDAFKNYGETRQNGNIAQEMAEIIPEAVFTTPQTGKMGINYEQLHAVYIKAIQELKAEIETLKNK